MQQSVRRRSSSPMNGFWAAIRPRCDAAGSNSVACFGGSSSKQPQGSPLDPAPTGNARGDVFTISLLQSAIFTQPDSIWPSVRCDGPFDSSSCLDRVVCLSGQDGPMACEGFRLPSNGNLSLALEEPIRLAELAPLRRHQKTRRPLRLLAPMA